MADFPLLKTGALAQYPAERVLRRPARVLGFVDGSEQSFPLQGSALRRWTLDLALLDEDELTKISQFFEDRSGALGDFGFTDPWDGTAYPNCRFESDAMSEQIMGEGRASTRVTIRQNRT